MSDGEKPGDSSETKIRDRPSGAITSQGNEKVEWRAGTENGGRLKELVKKIRKWQGRKGARARARETQSIECRTPVTDGAHGHDGPAASQTGAQSISCNLSEDPYAVGT